MVPDCCAFLSLAVSSTTLVDAYTKTYRIRMAVHVNGACGFGSRKRFAISAVAANGPRDEDELHGGTKGNLCIAKHRSTHPVSPVDEVI